jgi:hypothetical protein
MVNSPSVKVTGKATELGVTVGQEAVKEQRDE